MIATIIAILIMIIATLFALWRGSLADYRWLLDRCEWLEARHEHMEYDSSPIRCAGCGRFVKADNCVVGINGDILCKRCANEQ